MRTSYWAVIAIIAISLAASMYGYPRMGERVASHWNAQGQVDGYIPKFWGLFLMPMISIAMFLLFILIPTIDPMKENIGKFRKYFDWFIVLIMTFLLYLHFLTIAWNLGYRFNFVLLLVPAFGLLFYYAGILTQNAKRNWFIGIRTPWTLSSDVVWDKTHRIGGTLFKIAGVIALAGIIIPSWALYLILVPALAVAIYTFAYSYFAYKKETSRRVES